MHSESKNTDCSFFATNQLTGRLSDYYGKWLVLYFYPKDSTPGCTTEGRDFNTHLPIFRALNAEVFGISKDSLKSHDKFKEKEGFLFELITDESQEICQLFDVIKEKNMYGRKYLGIERSTFIIDPKGHCAHTWRNVKVPGHVQDVLTTLKKLQQEYSVS
jgi:peroxiredoxin Q/BCP